MFSPASTRAASVYKRVEVETSIAAADPHQLVSLLFTALENSIAAARSALRQKDIPAKCAAISRAVRILEEGLKAGLANDPSNVLAENLRTLYGCAIVRLSTANLKNDDTLLAEVESLIKPVAEAWRQIPR